MSGPFKMKGSPMKRNFGIGSPMRDEKERTEEQKNAILQGKLARWNKANPKATQDEMNDEQVRIWDEAREKEKEKTNE